MKDKFNDILKNAKTIFLEKPRYFYLNSLRVVSGLLFWLFMMFTFYSQKFLGQTIRVNVFGLKASFLYFIVFLAIPLLIAFFAAKENKRNLNLTIKTSTALSILYFLLMLLIYIGDRNSSSLITYRLGIGFYLLFLNVILMILTTFKPDFVVSLFERFFKFKHQDIVEAEILSEKNTQDNVIAKEE